MRAKVFKRAFTSSSGNIADVTVRELGGRYHILAEWDEHPSTKDAKEFEEWLTKGQQADIILTRICDKRTAVREGNDFLEHKDN